MEVSKEQFINELGIINNACMGVIQGIKGIMTNNDRLISMLNLEEKIDQIGNQKSDELMN